MFYRVQDFSFSNIDKFSAASIVTRLTTDVTNVQNAFQMLIRVAVRSPFMLIFSLIMAFGVNANLAWIFLIMVPVVGSVLCLIAVKAHPIFVKAIQTYDTLNTAVQENLHGIRVVKSYVREEYEKEKFQKVSDRIYRYFVKAEKIVAYNSPVMQFSVYGCILLLSWFGARLIVSESMTTGQLMSMIAYATQILMSLMMLSMFLVMIIIARASAQRVEEILEETSDLQNPDHPVYDVTSGDVCFRHVSFNYVGNPDKLSLKNVDLTIRSGETVGILGSTGSSKTSLVQLIPRLYDATEGEVLVGGIDVRQYDIQALRENVAMVLQKNVLFSGTIKENLRWGNEQADPPVMILDEATSSIDTRTEALVQRGMDRLMKGRTVFVIAHRLSTVQNADAILVLDHGRVMERGTHKELLQEKGMYYQLYTGAFEWE